MCVVAAALASSFAGWPAPLGDRAAQPPDGQQAHAHGEKAQDMVHCLSSTGTARMTNCAKLASNQTAENLLFHVAPITC